jgi:uncharacterized SAM-binding protein YcdF (DUF218 family)
LRSRRFVYGAAISVAFCLLLIFTHDVWLGWLGDVLVASKPPEKADAVLVLAGDPRGSRIRTAAELVRAGFVPKVLVSGPVEWYGVNEAELAVQFAISSGYPREWFEPVIIRALSTDEEARAFVPELEKRGIRRLLIVTSDFHTARAHRVFRRNIPSSIELRMVGAPDKYFRAHGWWHTREGRKTWFFETTKTLTEMAGM